MILLKLDTNEIIAIVTLVPIFLLLIIATVIGLVRRIKMAKLYKKSKSNGNEDLKIKLLEALGTADNIESVNVEMSRLTITVKDIDLINADLLKSYGANGVLLVGNMVKCSFGDRAEEISHLLG